MPDGTTRRWTLRISQREEEYVIFLKSLILAKGRRAWTYREGLSRNLYVVEFAKRFLEGHRIRTRRETIHYVRGYFDAEGSVASPRASNPYLYFGQKDRLDLEELRSFLGELNVRCGIIHNPSRRVDPENWRFFLLPHILSRFATGVGLWDPREAVGLRRGLHQGRQTK